MEMKPDYPDWNKKKKYKYRTWAPAAVRPPLIKEREIRGQQKKTWAKWNGIRKRNVMHGHFTSALRACTKVPLLLFNFPHRKIGNWLPALLSIHGHPIAIERESVSVFIERSLYQMKFDAAFDFQTGNFSVIDFRTGLCEIRFIQAWKLHSRFRWFDTFRMWWTDHGNVRAQIR